MYLITHIIIFDLLFSVQLLRSHETHPVSANERRHIYRHRKTISNFPLCHAHANRPRQRPLPEAAIRSGKAQEIARETKLKRVRHTHTHISHISRHIHPSPRRRLSDGRPEHHRKLLFALL